MIMTLTRWKICQRKPAMKMPIAAATGVELLDLIDDTDCTHIATVVPLANSGGASI